MKAIRLTDISSVRGHSKVVHIMGSSSAGEPEVLQEIFANNFDHEEFHLFLTRLAAVSGQGVESRRSQGAQVAGSHKTEASDEGGPWGRESWGLGSPGPQTPDGSGIIHGAAHMGSSRRLSSAESDGEAEETGANVAGSWAEVPKSVLKAVTAAGLEPRRDRLRGLAMALAGGSALLLTESGQLVSVMAGMDAVVMQVSEIQGLNIGHDGSMLHIEAGSKQITVQLDRYEPGPLRLVFKAVKQLMKEVVSKEQAGGAASGRVELGWLDEQEIPPFMRTPLNVPDPALPLHESVRKRHLLRERVQAVGDGILMQACSFAEVLAVTERQILFITDVTTMSVNISDIRSIQEQDQGNSFGVFGQVPHSSQDAVAPLFAMKADGFSTFQVRAVFRYAVAQAKSDFGLEIAGPPASDSALRSAADPALETSKDEFAAASPTGSDYSIKSSNSLEDDTVTSTPSVGTREHAAGKLEWLREIADQEHHGFSKAVAVAAGIDAVIALSDDLRLVYAEAHAAEPGDSLEAAGSYSWQVFRSFNSNVLFFAMPLRALADIGASAGSPEFTFVIHNAVALRLPLHKFSSSDLSQFMSDLKDHMKLEVQAKRMEMIPALKTNELFACLRREEVSKLFQKEAEERHMREKWKNWQRKIKRGLKHSSHVLLHVAGKSFMVAVTSQNELVSCGDGPDLQRVNLKGVKLVTEDSGDLRLVDDSGSPVYTIKANDLGPQEWALLSSVLQQRVPMGERTQASARTRTETSSGGGAGAISPDHEPETASVGSAMRDRLAAALEQAVKGDSGKLEAVAIGGNTAVGLTQAHLYYVSLKSGSQSETQVTTFELREVGEVSESTSSVLHIHRHTGSMYALWRHRSSDGAQARNAGALLSLDVSDFETAELQIFFQFLEYFASTQRSAADTEQQVLEAQEQILQSVPVALEVERAQVIVEMTKAADAASLDQGAPLFEIMGGDAHLILCKESMLVTVDKIGNELQTQTLPIKQISTIRHINTGEFEFLDQSGVQKLKILGYSFESKQFDRFMNRFNNYIRSIHSFDSVGRHPQITWDLGNEEL